MARWLRLLPGVISSSTRLRSLLLAGATEPMACLCGQQPDCRRPVRMQSGGRTAAEAERLRLRGPLWVRALRSRGVWRCAGRVALPASAVQFGLITAAVPAEHVSGWMLAGVCAVSLTMAVLVAAAACVRAQACRLESTSN